MNTVQFYDKIRRIDHLRGALDVYKKRRYPLDLSEDEYELLKEALDALERDLYVSRAKSEVEVKGMITPDDIEILESILEDLKIARGSDFSGVEVLEKVIHYFTSNIQEAAMIKEVRE